MNPQLMAQPATLQQTEGNFFQQIFSSQNKNNNKTKTDNLTTDNKYCYKKTDKKTDIG